MSGESNKQCLLKLCVSLSPCALSYNRDREKIERMFKEFMRNCRKTIHKLQIQFCEPNIVTIFHLEKDPTTMDSFEIETVRHIIEKTIFEKFKAKCHLSFSIDTIEMLTIVDI